MKNCLPCNGTGLINRGLDFVCKDCKGTGKVDAVGVPIEEVLEKLEEVADEVQEEEVPEKKNFLERILG